MQAALLGSVITLSAIVMFLGFLVFGTLRALGVLTWRLDQMELMRPSRIGREGLRIGRKAPNITLPSTIGGERSLSDFVGRKVLLVLTQSGCGPCMEIVPELNRLHERGEYQVLVVNNGDLESTLKWTAETKARFPVLSQENFSLSKRYEVFVTPYAFLIDEQGMITSKGIVGSKQYLGYVLSGAGNQPRHVVPVPNAEQAEKSETEFPVSTPTKEPVHV